MIKINSRFAMLFLCFFFSQSGFARITTNANDPEVKSKCADGTYSTSTGRGTCSHHGGVVYDDLPTRRKSNKKPKTEQPKILLNVMMELRLKQEKGLVRDTVE